MVTSLALTCHLCSCGRLSMLRVGGLLPIQQDLPCRGRYLNTSPVPWLGLRVAPWTSPIDLLHDGDDSHGYGETLEVSRIAPAGPFGDRHAMTSGQHGRPYCFEPTVDETQGCVRCLRWTNLQVHERTSSYAGVFVHQSRHSGWLFRRSASLPTAPGRSVPVIREAWR